MDRRTFFAVVVKASFEDFERADVVEASYENFEHNWVCCGLFFQFSYIVLNTDYCCGTLTCFHSRSRS